MNNENYKRPTFERKLNIKMNDTECHLKRFALSIEVTTKHIETFSENRVRKMLRELLEEQLPGEAAIHYPGKQHGSAHPDDEIYLFLEDREALRPDAPLRLLRIYSLKVECNGQGDFFLLIDMSDPFYVLKQSLTEAAGKYQEGLFLLSDQELFNTRSPLVPQRPLCYIEKLDELPAEFLRNYDKGIPTIRRSLLSRYGWNEDQLRNPAIRHAYRSAHEEKVSRIRGFLDAYIHPLRGDGIRFGGELLEAHEGEHFRRLSTDEYFYRGAGGYTGPRPYELLEQASEPLLPPQEQTVELFVVMCSEDEPVLPLLQQAIGTGRNPQKPDEPLIPAFKCGMRLSWSPERRYVLRAADQREEGDFYKVFFYEYYSRRRVLLFLLPAEGHPMRAWMHAMYDTLRKRHSRLKAFLLPADAYSRPDAGERHNHLMGDVLTAQGGLPFQPLEAGRLEGVLSLFQSCVPLEDRSIHLQMFSYIDSRGIPVYSLCYGDTSAEQAYSNLLKVICAYRKDCDGKCPDEILLCLNERVDGDFGLRLSRAMSSFSHEVLLRTIWVYSQTRMDLFNESSATKIPPRDVLSYSSDKQLQTRDFGCSAAQEESEQFRFTYKSGAIYHNKYLDYCALNPDSTQVYFSAVMSASAPTSYAGILARILHGDAIPELNRIEDWGMLLKPGFFRQPVS